MDASLHVGGLSPRVTEDEIRAKFEQYGRLRSVRLMRGKERVKDSQEQLGGGGGGRSKNLRAVSTNRDSS
jgi:RNA recognition motif-containing protein